MKKTVIVVIVIAILAAIGFVGYKTINNQPIIVGPNGNTQNSGEPTQNEHVEDGAAAKVTVQAVTVKNQTDNIIINNVYPKITSFTNKEFENAINKRIATNIAEYANEINYVKNDDDPEAKLKLYKYVTTYKKYTWGNYLTLVVERDYQTGGIRSNTWKDIYNIDVSKQRIIYLEDLFEATVDYEKEIIDEITKQAAQKNYKLMGGEGLSKLPTKQKFYIKEGKLYIYFDPSEAAAATYGALEFEMPFVLNSNGCFELAK